MSIAVVHKMVQQFFKTVITNEVRFSPVVSFSSFFQQKLLTAKHLRAQDDDDADVGQLEMFREPLDALDVDQFVIIGLVVNLFIQVIKRRRVNKK